MHRSKRITVKSHNVAFLESLASQMGIADISEALNYLILDIKGLNYQFGDKPAPKPQQVQIGYNFEPTFTPPIKENHHNSLEVDPTIQRLIDAGLEMDF